MDDIIIHTGERYDFLIYLKDSGENAVKNYWIRVEPVYSYIVSKIHCQQTVLNNYVKLHNIQYCYNKMEKYNKHTYGQSLLKQN